MERWGGACLRSFGVGVVGLCMCAKRGWCLGLLFLSHPAYIYECDPLYSSVFRKGINRSLFSETGPSTGDSNVTNCPHFFFRRTSSRCSASPHFLSYSAHFFGYVNDRSLILCKFLFVCVYVCVCSPRSVFWSLSFSANTAVEDLRSRKQWFRLRSPYEGFLEENLTWKW